VLLVILKAVENSDGWYADKGDKGYAGLRRKEAIREDSLVIS
jgi:hypothetical protein